MAIDEMFDLSGRVALITSAAGSLGSAIANVYADTGADLLLVDIDSDGLHSRANPCIQRVADISGHLR